MFLYALFPTVLVFFTPPVTLCHHLPSQRWSQSYLQTALRKIQGQKFALGAWTVEQKYNAHTVHVIFIIILYCVLCSLVRHLHIKHKQVLQGLLFLFSELTDNLLACVKEMTYSIFKYNYVTVVTN